MKLWEVARFEVAYQLRRRSTWLYAAAVLGLAFYTMKNFILGAREDGTFLDAPIDMVSVTFVTSMFGLVVTAALVGDAATRDFQTRMEALLFTASLRKTSYVGGRFLGTFALNAVLLLGAPVGILLALRTSGSDPELLGPFRLAALAQPYLFFALPNAFVSGALLYAAALLTRRALTSYVVGACVFVATMFNWQFVAQVLGRWDLATHLDPLGGTAIAFLVRSWTPLERNVLLVPFEGPLLTNRILWLALAAAVLAFANLRFRLAHHAPRQRWSRRGRPPALPETAAGAAAAESAPIAVPPGRRSFGPATRLRQTLAVAGRSFRDIATSRASLAAVGATAFLVLLGPELMVHLGVPLVPTTSRVLTVFVATGVHHLVVALTVLYAGELVWKDRDAGADAIADAAPVPDRVLLAGKLLGLAGGIVALQALLMAAGVAVQARLGHPELEPGLYLAVLFGFQLADHLLFAALALAVHVLVSQKALGHLVVLLAYAYTLYAGALGIEHDLLVYGSDVGWAHSDMSGFGSSVAPFLLFKLYWAGWALLLVLAARLFWVRGTERGLRERLRAARERLTRPALATAVLGAALIVAAGGLIFYDTHVANDHLTSAERTQRRAEYERRYARYEGVPQPRLVRTKLHVEIDPQARAVASRGTYGAVNRSGVAIDRIHLATASEAETGVIDFDRAARPVLLDDDLGHRIYALDEPLQPGDEIEIRFAVRFAPRGLTGRAVQSSVAANGTYFERADWLPAIGYQPGRELSGAGVRRTHGLAPRPAARSLDDAAARQEVAGRAMIDLEVTVGTARGQIAVAPGTLRRAWEEDGRRYFHYATDAPIRDGYALFSADYRLHQARWRDVAIQIFHHPGHRSNLDRMVRGVQASLDHFTERLGPYPHRQIRLVEVPGAGIGLRAHPIDIRYTEGFALLDPEADHRDVDLPFAVVAHEVAHQWWGNQLAPADVEGAPLLAESLAWYSAFGVVEATYGEAHLHRLLGVLREAYQHPRPQADVPLLRATDWFTAYRKGPLTMYALRESIGEERMDAALRRLFERHGAGVPPLPTSLDLYAELQAVTPEPLRPLLADLLERNTFWQMKVVAATAEPAGEAGWRVTLDVTARKVEVDETGVQTVLAMDDLVEIGVFAADLGVAAEPLYLHRHRVRSGPQRITVTVPREPGRAGIDPRHLLIDTEPHDNTVTLDTRGARG